jgi:predicted nucleotide-binding protein
LSSSHAVNPNPEEADKDAAPPVDDDANPEGNGNPARQMPDSALAASRATPSPSNRKVFITHGKNKVFIEPIKKLLAFGELEAVVSVERQSVSQPVPDKVLNDMRLCGAAIIHVEGEMRLVDQQAKEHIILNPNVLIEIGAAMALYGKRFILLVKEGVSLPSNLQGLYEVRYRGDVLDGDATIKLLEAINALKEHDPSRTAI